MSKRALTTAAAATIAAVASGLAGGTLAGASATGPDCTSSFNPYDYSQAQVSACGYTTFSESDVAALPGGGSRYDYSVDGTNVHFLVPPSGFNPSTASAAQLDEYGFPPRPTEATAVSQWQTELSSWKGSATPPPFLAESHTQANSIYDTNWAGYELTGAHSTFTHAQAWYAEPTFYSSVCASNEEVTWAGIGGSGPKDPDLGQNGTAHNVPGVGNHQAWWEILPTFYIMPINFSATAGYMFIASTRWTGDGYRFYFYNYANKTTTALDVDSTAYSGDSAEAVAERPFMSNGHLSYLSNFGTLTFYYSQANGAGFDTYPATSVRHGVHMEDVNFNDMADPSDIGGGGYFTVHQQSCD